MAPEKKNKKTTAGEAKQALVREKLRHQDNGAIYVQIDNIDKLNESLNDALRDNDEGFLAVDTETDGLNTAVCDILGFSFCGTERQAYWVPLHGDLVEEKAAKLTVLAYYLECVTALFYNAEFDIGVLEKHGCAVGDFQCVMKAAHFYNPNAPSFGLKQVAEKLLGAQTVEMKEILNCKKDEVDFMKLAPNEQRIYGCQDADLTMQLWDIFNPAIPDKHRQIWDLEHALTRPVIAMKHAGVMIDPDKMKEFDDILRAEIESRVEKLRKWSSNPDFNLRSPLQKQKLLYEKLGLTIPWRTPTGQGSTEAQYLEAIRHEHEAVGVIMEAMSFSVLQRSFTSVLPGKIDIVTGRMHPSLWPMGTSTGRFSCSMPNLQNVPKDVGDDSPVNIRNAFVSRPGWSFIDCDYSQIELMIAAWLSKEPLWWEAYVNGEDVHRNTAMKIYGVSDPTDKQRNDGKGGNYQLLYGQGAKNFGRKYGMPLEKAEQFVDAWIAAVPRFAAWRERVKMDARQTGKAHTYFGRLRPMDGIFSDDRKTAAEWERRAVSHTIQGTAADLMKMAIVRVHKELTKHPSLPTEMILQVHDELLSEARDDAVGEATGLIRDRMTIMLDGFVPLKVDVKTGKKWGSCR